MKKKKKIPTRVKDIVLRFPAKMEAYECFVFSRRLELAYEAVRDVLGLSVKGVVEANRRKNRVTARRFICRVMAQQHPDAGVQLLGSAILKDHATVVHYRKYDIGERYNYYYTKRIPFLEARFEELLKEKDFDLVDDGKLYSVEEIRRLFSSICGISISMKVTRAAKRRDNGKKERRELPIHQIHTSKKRTRVPALVQKRSQ